MKRIGDRAVFMDRDGTVNEEVGYLGSQEQLELIPGAVAAIARLNEARLKVVIVTNQAGVARGYFPESRVNEIHAALGDLLLADGARVDKFYYCPHHPTEGAGEYATECDCRKPKPGMLLRAARELNIDLSRSFMVGDKLSDLEAGVNAGCGTVIVKTGYGCESVAHLHRSPLTPDRVANDLVEACEWILQTS